MTELRRDDAPPRRGRDRASGPGPVIPPGVRDVVERSASLRRGLAMLHRAPSEAMAAALGVHPRAVDQARERLERRSEREPLIGLFARAAARRPRDPHGAADLPTRRGPDALIAEAGRHVLGVDFLRHAHPETVAVTFTVHPETVLRARELLDARPPPAGDPS